MLVTNENTIRLPGLGTEYMTSASDLGLPPGQWPEQMSTTLGNKRAFLFVDRTHDEEGELQSVQYRQATGNSILTVVND